MSGLYPHYKFISSNCLQKLSLLAVYRTNYAHRRVNFKHFIKLYRINNLNGFWLLFIPTFGSLTLASNSLLPKPSHIVLFALGSFTARSTGCVINDLADRQFDSKVVFYSFDYL